MHGSSVCYVITQVNKILTTSVYSGLKDNLMVTKVLALVVFHVQTTVLIKIGVIVKQIKFKRNKSFLLGFFLLKNGIDSFYRVFLLQTTKIISRTPIILR